VQKDEKRCYHPAVFFVSALEKPMTRLSMFVFVLAIVAMPSALLAGAGKPGKPEKPTKEEKSVPAPPQVLLLGVAGGVAAAHKLWQNRR
jgi:hypothetical protein